MKYTKIIFFFLFSFFLYFSGFGIIRVSFDIPVSHSPSYSLSSDSAQKLDPKGNAFGLIIMGNFFFNTSIGYENIQQRLKYGTNDHAKNITTYNTLLLSYSIQTRLIKYQFGLGGGSIDVKFRDEENVYEGSGNLSKFFFVIGYRFDNALDIHLGFHQYSDYKVEAKNKTEKIMHELKGNSTLLTFGATYGF